MKHWPWPLSCLYIPLALCVFFSEATLGASSQSELTLTTKSSHPSDGREEQKKSHGETKQAANPQTEPPRIPVTIEGPVTIINQPSANEQERKANEQSKNIWDKLWTDVVLNPHQWVNVGALVIARMCASGFAYAAYCATRRQANAAEQTLALASTPRLHIDVFGWWVLKRSGTYFLRENC